MEDFEPGAIWPADDPDSEQIREVYSRFGLAMYMAQVLEHGMVNALLVLRVLPTMKEHADRTSWDDAFERFYDAELAKTFGNMVRALEDAAVPKDMLDRLRAAKVHRDHLAHRFFREHDLDFMTRAGRTKMIAECEDLVELFRWLDRDLEALVGPQLTRFGITPEWIEKHARLIEREARLAPG
ncbi:MAG: hypothetical protein C0510_01335 [Erythrobacter sp.]|nr:hypothetical protein [Erythrobacter sp.]